MGLDVIWKNERGEELGAFRDTTYAFVHAVVDLSERDFPILGPIDAYRTTLLTPTDSILSEVSRVRDSIADSAAREQLSHLVALIRRASVSPGTYLEFVGD